MLSQGGEQQEIDDIGLEAPATRHALLMIVTTRRSVQDKIAGLQAGADDYLIKPVELSQFLAHVASINRFRRLIHNPLTGPSI